MNKNPFVPQPSYPPHQPPPPPGPLPPPPQSDYSAYWATASSSHQQQQVHPTQPSASQPQWCVPQPVPPSRPPPADQSALYANYGYSAQWQRQQQQQQLQQMQAQQFHAPAPPVASSPPQAIVQPGYNPYQPAAGYPQTYVGQATLPPVPHTVAQTPYSHPQPPLQQAQQLHPFSQSIPHIPQQQQQQHRLQLLHATPHHLPPAKRQRFDGPHSNRHLQNQQHNTLPQPQPQVQIPSPQNFGPYANQGRGGPPGMGHLQAGAGRGGLSTGRGGSSGGQRGGRGFQISGMRGGVSGGRARGGGSVYGSGGTNAGGTGRPGGGSGTLRGHGSRGNFGNREYRRGGGPNMHQGGSFRNRVNHAGSNRSNRHDGGSTFGTRDGTFGSDGKKDENRRTLTDFKIVGLEICELHWTWGILPAVDPEEGEPKIEELVGPTELPEVSVKEDTSDQKMQTKSEATEEPALLPTVFANKHTDTDNVFHPSPEVIPNQEGLPPSGNSAPSDIYIPPSRIRIYFHTPVTADDSRPIPSSFSLGPTPSDSRKGKRKKLEDDDSEFEEQRARPPPQQVVTSPDDRSSLTSVTHSAAETASEADWLMPAIVENEDDAAAPEATGGDDIRDAEDEMEHIQVSQLVATQDSGDPLEDTRSAGRSLTNGESGDCSMQHCRGIQSTPSIGGYYYGKQANLSLQGDHIDVEMAAGFDAVSPVSFGAEKVNMNDDMPPIGDAILGSEDSDATVKVAESELAQPGREPVHVNGISPADSFDGECRESGIDPSPPSAHFSNAPSVCLQPEASVSAATASLQSVSSVSSSAENLPAKDAKLLVQQDNHSTPYVTGALESLPSISKETTLPDISLVDPLTVPSSDASVTTIAEENDGGNEHVEDEVETQPDDSAVTHEVFHEVNQSADVPVSPDSSNTFLSTSSTSVSEDTFSIPKPEVKCGKLPSPNRLSISYACGNRRLVIDAEVVEKLKVFRKDGRVEVLINLDQEDDGFKGILVEGLSNETKSYLPLHTQSEVDPTTPPFTTGASIPSSIVLRVYLDTARPLSEPKWVKTGDIQEWLKSMFGRMFWVAGDAADGWEKKVQVVDPDPPPTIWTVLEGWAANSPAGTPTERQRFLKTHMTENENILEILLRLVRGERATASYQSASAISALNLSGPLLQVVQGFTNTSQQTHVSLAVLAIYRMLVSYAQKADPEKGKSEVEEHVGEIIRCLPSHLIYKSLDGIFKEWRVEKKGR